MDPNVGAYLRCPLTGYGMPEDRMKASCAGFNVRLIKPVGLPELEAALQL